MSHSDYPQHGSRDRFHSEEAGERNLHMRQDIDDVLTRFIEWDGDDAADLQVWFGHILKQYGLPSHGFDRDFVSTLASCGWFIFADYDLAPKFHRTRCVIDLGEWELLPWLYGLQRRALSKRSAEDFADRDGHIKWSPLLKCLRRICDGSSHYEISLSSEFHQALQRTNTVQAAAFGATWIEKELVTIFEQMRTDPGQIYGNGVQSVSWELWGEKNELLAADIGLRIGGVYSSLTGFSDRRHPSIGIVQLATEALLLKKLGFKIWDLGMEIPYKLDLGAKKMLGREYRAIFTENDFESIEGCIQRTSLSELSDFIRIKNELIDSCAPANADHGIV